MAEGKTNQELLLERQLKILMAEERAINRVARQVKNRSAKITFKKRDIVNGIIMREILGPPKAYKGRQNDKRTYSR